MLSRILNQTIIPVQRDSILNIVFAFDILITGYFFLCVTYTELKIAEATKVQKQHDSRIDPYNRDGGA